MSSTASPPTLTLKEHFDNAIFVLCRGMGFAVLKGGVARAIFWVLHAHVRAIASRFNQALARGPIKPRNRPEPTTRREPTPPKPRALPKYLRGWIPAYFNGESLPQLGSAFGYAKAALNHFCMVNNGIEHITYLFTLPDFIEAVETNPALGRILRPLCHMFAIKLPPYLQRPKRPRPPKPTPDPTPTPEPKPKQPKPPRQPRDGGFSLIGIHPERSTGPLYHIPSTATANRKKPA